MVMSGLMLASYSVFGGGAIGNIFAQWEQAGVFAYALPFLLLFSLIFAILSFVPLFKDNKGINAVIAISVSLMAMQFDFVSIFFSQIFPRLGIALSIVLVLIILLGLLIRDDEKGNQMVKWMMAISIIVIAIVVIVNSMNSFGFTSFGNGAFGSFLRYNIGNIIIIGLIVGAVIAIIASQSPKTKAKMPVMDISPLFGKGK